MLNFNKWQKIADKVSDYNLEKKDQKIFSKTTKWIATEKIHGANFSIYYNLGSLTSEEPEIKFAKRNGFLSDTEWFYNYQLIKPKLIKNVKQIATILNKQNIIVYGELFGGFYPSDPSKFNINQRINDKGISVVQFEQRAVQEGIYYSPNIEYIVFDIAIYDENNKPVFISYNEMMNCVKQTELLYAKPLIIDTFDKVMQYNINFDSTIPQQLGLVQMIPKTNLAEGIVIRPMDNYMLPNNNRCLIKIKNKKFLEVKYNSSTESIEQITEQSSLFINLINQNRLNAVISKNGQLTELTKEQILNEFVEDVWSDYYSNCYANCSNVKSNVKIDNIEYIDSLIKKYCEILINENLSMV